MPKTSIDPVRHALSGATMGTRWSALFFTGEPFDTTAVQATLAAAVGAVDDQMTTWRPESDLMRLNRAAPDTWVTVPEQLMEVLARGLEIGRASGGAFDITMGDVVGAWGFGPDPSDPARIRTEFGRRRLPAWDALELEPNALRARKHAALAVDLSGIAKGYGVDRMNAVLDGVGIAASLTGLDGELGARGLRPDRTPWAVALERPDRGHRAPLSMIELQDAAVATSGDYRHWVDVGGLHLSHTMDPARGGPVMNGPASVTVVAERCIEADAWATALMVIGTEKGARLCRELGLNALFVDREGDELRQTPVGGVFGAAADVSPTHPAGTTGV